MALRRMLLGILITLLFSLAANAITPIAPEDGEQTTNQQPLFSWTDYAGTLNNYTLTISQEADLTPAWHSFVTKNPYHQLQEPLPPGTWYWQAVARGTTTASTPVTTLTIIERPSFSIVPDTTRYDDNKRVDFIINAPLGSTVNVNITKQRFLLPFTTNNLQATSFTTFLEPGDYTITASFMFEGARANYANILSLKDDQVTEHAITFNVTTSDDEPLEDTTITIKGEEKNYTLTTGTEGNATITLKAGYYEFLIGREGYFDDEFNKKIDSERSFRVFLIKEEAATATDTPQLAATSVIPNPVITITSPTYKETITEPPLTVTFTLTENMKVASCDLLYRTAEQQGWTLASTTTKVSEKNILKHASLEQGESIIKIQCALKNHEKTVTSEARTITIALPPEHHEAIQEFLEELQEAVKSIPSSNDPLFVSMGIQGSIAAAKKRLAELDNNYIEQLTQGNEQEAATVSKTIDQELASLRNDLITAFTIIEKEDTIIEPDTEGLKSMIKEWAFASDLTDRQRQQLRADMLEDQATYTIRTKTSVAKLDTLGGNQHYVTGVTRTIQRYYGAGEERTTMHIIEELPSYFLQQTGTPRVLDNKGEEIVSIDNERATITLMPDESYTLLFSGNVKSAAAKLDAILVLRHENVTAYLEGTTSGTLSSITGAVVNVIGGIGGFSPFVWVFLAIIIATFIINPFTTISLNRKDKNVTRLTDTIHDTLDLMEQGMHDQAFQNYPSIIDAYEQLKQPQQEHLSFAITNLSSALHLHTMNQTIAQTMMKLDTLSSRAELTEVYSMTRQIIDDYGELDAHGRDWLKPSLQSLQRQLKEKHSFLTSPKPKKHYPLP